MYLDIIIGYVMQVANFVARREMMNLKDRTRLPGFWIEGKDGPKPLL